MHFVRLACHSPRFVRSGFGLPKERSMLGRDSSNQMLTTARVHSPTPAVSSQVAVTIFANDLEQNPRKDS